MSTAVAQLMPRLSVRSTSNLPATKVFLVPMQEV